MTAYTQFAFTYGLQQSQEDETSIALHAMNNGVCLKL